MWRSIMICGILLATLFVVPANATFACRSNCSGGAGSPAKPNIFSPQTQVNGAGIYSERINYMLQFNIGQNISLIEIAPIGSTDWTPLVDGSQTSLHTTNGRIVHFRQDIFDGIYTFDIRVNGAVVWHNINVKNGRLIVLGYDNAPIVVGVFDRNTNLRLGIDMEYCPVGYLNLFSPKNQFKHSQSVYSESIDYNLQFNIGEDVSLIEIAPVGSNNWTPIVDASQTTLETRSSRIARIRQDIFDKMYNFDVRINGAVVWHNIEFKNDRLVILGYDITLGYNNAPVVVDIIDAFRRACVPNA